jgi:integrase/recombinase XerD
MNYLKNGGRLDIAQRMVEHESSRTTRLYDRRGDEISLDEVELRIQKPLQAT